MRLIAVFFMTLLCAPVWATQTISPRAYEALTRIQTLMAENKLNQAATELNELRKDVSSSPLALALTLQTSAQLEMQRNNLSDAQAYLQRALGIEGLENTLVNQLRTFSAQLYFAADNYAAVINGLLPWLNPRPQDAPAPAFALLAAAYYADGHFSEGLPFIEEALQRSAEIKEPWLLMAFAGHYQLQRWERAAFYAGQLISYFPQKKDYWLQKSGVLQLQGKLNEAAAVRYAASLQGIEFTEQEVLSFARLLAARGVPYKTAQVLNALDEKSPLEEKSRRLLLQAWLQAREREKARRVLEDLFEDFAQVDDGILLMQLQLDAQSWASVLPLAARLLDKKLSDKQHGLILMYQGIALFRSGKTAQGIESMLAATRFEEVKSQASAWQLYMQQVSVK